jgi:hypothetical protein
MKSPTVRCADCGFLAVRAMLVNRKRVHSGCHEVEQFQRDSPAAVLDFVPGDTNAWQQGELVCFRHAADLPRERVEIAVTQKISEDQAIRAAIWNPRSCDKWDQYEPGIDPPRHLADSVTRAQADQAGRLAKIAIWLTVIIGVPAMIAAFLAITNDSIGLRWFKAAVAWLSRS